MHNCLIERNTRSTLQSRGLLVGIDMMKKCDPDVRVMRHACRPNIRGSKTSAPVLSFPIFCLNRHNNEKFEVRKLA